MIIYSVCSLLCMLSIFFDHSSSELHMLIHIFHIYLFVQTGVIIYFIVLYCLSYYSCPCFFSFCLPTPPLHSLRPSPQPYPSPWVMHICSFTNPFTFFHPVPTATALAAVSQFHVTKLLFLFCLLLYFVH